MGKLHGLKPVQGRLGAMAHEVSIPTNELY